MAFFIGVFMSGDNWEALQLQRSLTDMVVQLIRDGVGQSGNAGCAVQFATDVMDKAISCTLTNQNKTCHESQL